MAVVTGGSRGIGRSTVNQLAERGIDVIFTYRSDAASADAVIKEAGAHGARVSAIPFDVSDVDALEEFVGQVRSELSAWVADRLNYLVNNAGIWHTASFADTTVDDFDRLSAVNVRGVFFVTQKLVPLMADGGRILNLSSGLTRFTFPNKIAYGALKGASNP